MSRMAGMWKRRVKVWGFLGAKMFNKAIRQYNRASALSQRRSSLKGEQKDVCEEKKTQKTIPAAFSCWKHFNDIPEVFWVMATTAEQILNHNCLHSAATTTRYINES